MRTKTARMWWVGCRMWGHLHRLASGMCGFHIGWCALPAVAFPQAGCALAYCNRLMLLGLAALLLYFAYSCSSRASAT